MAQTLLVYGTLRSGGSETVRIRGTMYDLGHYPGVLLGGDHFIVCEPKVVHNLARVDRYEGFYPSAPEHSLYIRRLIRHPRLGDCWIYEYNNLPLPSQTVESGDWLLHKRQQRGSHGNGHFI